MARWIYILGDNQGYYYVGYTKQLFRRWISHMNKRGAEATSRFTYDRIEAIYPIPNEISYSVFENQITLQMMKIHTPAKVRGGKYCKHFDSDQPMVELYKKIIKELADLPSFRVCACRFPATSSSSSFFCPRSSMEWVYDYMSNYADLDDYYSLDQPCDNITYLFDDDQSSICQVCNIQCEPGYDTCYPHRKEEKEEKEDIPRLLSIFKESIQ